MADVLLVDDDADVRELLGDLLGAWGHSVRLAEDGVVALHRLDDRVPQLVVSDVEMPRLGGLEMIYRMFIENLGRENVPVVLISGRPGLEGIAAAAGTPYFLSKPFDIEPFQRVVDRALREGCPPRLSVLAH